MANDLVGNPIRFDTPINIYTSDFSAGVDGWGVSNGAAAGNIDTIGGQDDNLRFTIDGTNAAHRVNKPTVNTIGKTYRARFDYYIPSGQSNIDGIRPATALFIGSTQTVLDAWTAVDIYYTATDTTFYIYAFDGALSTFQDAGSDDVFYIRNVIIDEEVTLWSKENRRIKQIQWVDDNADIVDNSNLVLIINGVTIEYTPQKTSDIGWQPPVCAEIGPFAKGVLINSFVVGSITEGQLLIWEA